MKKIFLLAVMATLSLHLPGSAQCPEALMRYADRYPAAEAQDLYKLVFQDLYGPGHLISDSATSARYIADEVANMDNTDAFPLYEYTLCDSHFVRVNLALVRSGVLPLDKFVSSLLRSTEGLPAPDGRFVLSHSDAFKSAYHPHYRIVRRDIFENEILPLLSAAGTPARRPAGRPQNVILIIGDGMGVPQVYASVVAQRANRSAFLRFPVSGFSRTYSRNRYRTDSSAGGTALTTGHKVDNYHVNWGPEAERYNTIFDDAQRQDMSTGFVVTSSVLDATPAATYGHVPYRKMFDTLSLQMAQCGHSVMMGGGYKYFLPQNRKDGLAPLDTLATRGYTVLRTLDDARAFQGDRMVALLYDGDPLTEPARGDMLRPAAMKAIEMLQRNPQGFALMIEGSQIDWACHNNDSAYLRAELADFELMLHAVLDFAERDGHTLVVVTADHETGGVTLPDGNIEQGVNEVRFLWGDHTGCMVPVFAYGPGAQIFSGIQENTDIPAKIRKLMKL